MYHFGIEGRTSSPLEMQQAPWLGLAHPASHRPNRSGSVVGSGSAERSSFRSATSVSLARIREVPRSTVIIFFLIREGVSPWKEVVGSLGIVLGILPGRQPLRNRSTSIAHFAFAMNWIFFFGEFP